MLATAHAALVQFLHTSWVNRSCQWVWPQGGGLFRSLWSLWQNIWAMMYDAGRRGGTADSCSIAGCPAGAGGPAASCHFCPSNSPEGCHMSDLLPACLPACLPAGNSCHLICAVDNHCTFVLALASWPLREASPRSFDLMRYPAQAI